MFTFPSGFFTPSAPAGFNPQLYGTCLGWYDAGDASKVSLSGSNVTGITDKSGFGNNLSTVTASFPTYNLAAQNGLNTISSVSSAVQNSVSGINGLTEYEITLFLAISTNSALSSYSVFSNLYNSLLRPDNFGGTTYAIGNAGTASFADGLTGFQQYTVHFLNTGVDVWQNGVLKASVTGSTVNPVYTFFSLFGESNGGADWWVGSWGEGLIYQGAVTGANQTPVESHLASRWAT